MRFLGGIDSSVRSLNDGCMDETLKIVLIALGIFLLRICDVSIGTVRVIFTIKGYRAVSAILGVVESFIWILAISQVMKYVNHPLSMLGWACGFATGTVVGISLEKWIGTGSVMVRIISRKHAIRLKELLAAEGFGVTALAGHGVGGEVLVLFVVLPRKRERQLVEMVQQIDDEAFMTVESVNQTFGGFAPASPLLPGALRK